MQYDTCVASASVKSEVEDFLLDNDLLAYFLGVSQDFKHFGFAVSVLILNEDGTKVVRLLRKEACYCRFAPADASGKIPSVLYANWRKCISSRKDIEVIDLLDPASPWRDLQDKLAKKSKIRKFAIVSRIPTVDSTYAKHTYGCLRLNNGTPLHVVQHMLGHKNITTTEVYAKMNDEQKMQTVSRITLKRD